MEPASVICTASGPVESLEIALQQLVNFASRFASEILQELNSSLRTTWTRSELDEVSAPLEIIEQWLKELLEIDRDEGKLCRCPRCQNDMKQAQRIMLHAWDMVKNIKRTVRELQDRRSSLGDVTCHQANKFMAPRLPRSALPVPATSETYVHQVFACIGAPNSQESFHTQLQEERVSAYQWLLDSAKFQSWHKSQLSTGSESIFCCRGEPGVGKTMFASSIIDKLRNQLDYELVAYFYVRTAPQCSASDVAASLLRQLCVHFQVVPRCLKYFYEQSKGKSDHGPKFKALLGALKETSREISKSVIFVLDGLDGIRLHEQNELEKVFRSLKKTSWKCLVTSRDDLNVSFRALEDCTQVSVEERDVARDVNKFVDAALEDNEATDELLCGSVNDNFDEGKAADRLFCEPALRETVIENITSHAHGKFHWAKLLVRRILDQTTLSDIKKALASIPDGIDGIVQLAMDMINRQSQPRALLATRTLALITSARVPMIAEALSHALGIYHALQHDDDPQQLAQDDIPHPLTIIQCCEGLVTIDPTTRIIAMAHYDVAQYMQTQWDKLFSTKVKYMFADITLAYLSLDTFSSGSCDTADALVRRLKEYPFLDYASHYWGHHIRQTLSLPGYHVQQTFPLPQQARDPIAKVVRLLERRTNLECSIQVCDRDPRCPDAPVITDHIRSMSSLQVATCHGLTKIARGILRTNPKAALEVDSNGKSALHEAARAGWEDLVDVLLAAGSQPWLCDYQGKSPFYYAARHGHSKIISTLLACGDPSHSEAPAPHALRVARSGHDETVSLEFGQALCDAVEAGHVDIIERLQHVNFTPKVERNEKSALMVAICRDYSDIVRVLLDASVHPSCPDRSPSDLIFLHQAIRHGHRDVAALLIDYGANIQTRDNLQRNALFESIKVSDTDGADLLLFNGIDGSAYDLQANTVLHEAARIGAYEHTVLFIDQGLEPNHFNVEGFTPLHLALQNGHSGISLALLEKGADAKAHDRKAGSARTPLMYAASAGLTYVCEKLLCHKVDVEAVSSDGKTALMLAAAAGHVDVAQLLCSWRPSANLNILDNEGKTALKFAADADHVSIVQFLLDEGADVRGLKYEPEIPEDTAAEITQRRIRYLLGKYGAIVAGRILNSVIGEKPA